MISWSTFPASTLWSWLTSPTSRIRLPFLIAPISFRNVDIPSIETSSTTMISASIGSFSDLKYSPSSFGWYSMVLWIVIAFLAVVSFILWAARPAGAQSANLGSSPNSSIHIISIYLKSPLTVVVFPVPGSPVNNLKPVVLKSWNAWRCWFPNANPLSFSICSINSGWKLRLFLVFMSLAKFSAARVSSSNKYGS